MKKSVVFVAQMRNLGGVEKSLINLLNKLPCEKYDVTVAVLGKYNSIVNEIPEWINIQYISSCGLKQYLKKCIKRFHIIKVLQVSFGLLVTKLTKKHYFKQFHISTDRCSRLTDDCDVAISWALPDAFENIYTLNNVNAKKKIMWVHMDLQHYKMPSDSLKYLQHYDSIVSVSNACKVSLDLMYPELKNKSCVLYNFIDKQSIVDASQQESDFVVDSRKITIVTCGRLAKEKRPFFAIDICSMLLHEGIANFKWYFVGDGPLKDSFNQEIIKNGLQEYIVLLGNKANPYTYVKNADLYVQMSRHESFCLTLAEAQILGVPAVSTNFPAAYEIVDDGNTGFISQQSPEALFNIINKIATNEIDLKTLKETTLKRDCSAFSGDFIKFEYLLSNIEGI